jgi:hypothetical protein
MQWYMRGYSAVHLKQFLGIYDTPKIGVLGKRCDSLTPKPRVAMGSFTWERQKMKTNKMLSFVPFMWTYQWTFIIIIIMSLSFVLTWNFKLVILNTNLNLRLVSHHKPWSYCTKWLGLYELRAYTLSTWSSRRVEPRIRETSTNRVKSGI